MKSLRRNAHWLLALTPLPLFLMEGQSEAPYLPEDTHWHYLFALFSAMGFFVPLFFQRRSISSISLVLSALFVGTVGVVLLLVFQRFACGSLGFEISDGSFRSILWMSIVRLIGFSYQCIHEPNASPLLTFLGYTVGVGLCEEVCKALPVFYAVQKRGGFDRQDALVLGLACGVGFGVSEGIHYAATRYNGSAGPVIYLVRFVSCVGLHAMWTGTAALLIGRSRTGLDDGFGPVLQCLGLSILAHGLYDTFLCYEQTQLAARLVAVVSFVILTVVLRWRS